MKDQVEKLNGKIFCYCISCKALTDHSTYNKKHEGLILRCSECGLIRTVSFDELLEILEDDKRIEQINNTDTIEVFINGKKTVFVREGKKEEEIMGQNGN